MDNLIAQPMSKAKIHHIAEAARKMILESEDPYEFPIVKAIENLTKYDSRFNYEIVEDCELPNAYANYCPANNTMTIRQSVYTGALNGHGRDRFTLAHELGHYFLHDDETTFSRTSGAVVPTYKNPEWQANTFASAILMPRRLIRNMTATDIADRCSTSFTAASIALEDAAK